MVKIGKWIARHKVLILILGILLVVPSVIGMAKTRVNYDLLSYLPEHLETVKGQDLLVDEYGMGGIFDGCGGGYGTERRAEAKRGI